MWELFLQQVEVNSQQHGDISRNFCQTIGNGLVERIFYRKIQSKKIFAHRDRIETIILKSNELLLKVIILSPPLLHSFSLSRFLVPPTTAAAKQQQQIGRPSAADK